MVLFGVFLIFLIFDGLMYFKVFKIFFVLVFVLNGYYVKIRVFVDV